MVAKAVTGGWTSDWEAWLVQIGWRAVGRGEKRLAGLTVATVTTALQVIVTVMQLPSRGAVWQQSTEREGRTLQALQHPYIPPYRDCFAAPTAQGAALHLVQERSSGKPLSHWIETGWRPTEVCPAVPSSPGVPYPPTCCPVCARVPMLVPCHTHTHTHTNTHTHTHTHTHDRRMGMRGCRLR